MTELAVVTVIHNTAAELERLLRSLDRALDRVPRVVVVDSGSTDDGAAVARNAGVEVVSLPGNPGFGASCNAGLEKVGEPVTALLNPDVELLDGGLQGLAAEAAGRDVLLAPTLLSGDGSIQDSAHPVPGTLEALVPALIPRPLLPGPLRRRYEPWRSSRPRRVGWAIGACLVGRTDLLRRLGPFEARDFLFYEDLDLCLRAADAAVPTELRPEVALRHRGGASTARAFGGEALELRARRRRQVVGRRGRVALALDDSAQALTFATRAAGRRLIRRGGERERAQLRALRAARTRGEPAPGGCR